MEDQDFPLLGVFEGFLGVMGDEVNGVLVNDSGVYGVLERDSGVWSSH